MVRTLAEVNADRVRVTVELLDERPAGYDPDKAAEVLAENYQRARTRITELEREVTAFKNAAETHMREAGELDALVHQERQRAEKLKTELARVNENRQEYAGWLKTAEDELIKLEPEVRSLRIKVNGLNTELARAKSGDVWHRADKAETELGQVKETMAGYEELIRAYDLERQKERDRASRAEAEVRRLTRLVEHRFSAAEVDAAKAYARASEGARIRSEIRGLLNNKRIEDATRRPDPEADADFIGSPMGSWSALNALVADIRGLLDN